ncbi:MAG: hypothetical protein IBX62_09850 [Coriobacteriia bacterium]|nr:hypothetical protein [Coriobacteriia bacterium]
MKRPIALVTVMWVLTGGFLGSQALHGGTGHPTANPGQVVLLLMVWMSIPLVAAFLRFAVAPAELASIRTAAGEEAARERAASLAEASWYLLGLMPYCSLLAFSLTGWPAGAAALWAGGFASMLLLAPDPAAFERQLAGSR